MPNKQVERVRVFAIESQNALDMLANRTEADTLQAVCKLLGHEFASTFVRSKAEFETAVDYITTINEAELSEEELERPLCLHLAAYGNENEIGLGSDCASWEYLAKTLYKFSRAMKDYKGPLLLVISACYAENQLITKYFAKEAKRRPTFGPATYVLTTIGDIDWEDAVVAWTIFYHQIGKAGTYRSKRHHDYCRQDKAGGCRRAQVLPLG